MTIQPGKAVSLAKVLASLDEHAGSRLLVSGQVDSVCTKKGCWLRLTDVAGTETVFVKFTCRADGRLIPMAAVGHQAFVEGVLTVEEIAKILGPKKHLSMKAPSARIEGLRTGA